MKKKSETVNFSPNLDVREFAKNKSNEVYRYEVII